MGRDCETESYLYQYNMVLLPVTLTTFKKILESRNVETSKSILFYVTKITAAFQRFKMLNMICTYIFDLKLHNQELSASYVDFIFISARTVPPK